MAQCTAPIKGHTPGSLSEKECPVHGQKHRKPTPIRKFATININNNTAKNSISNIPYNELNLPQKAQREAHIEILVDDIGVTT